MDNTYFILSKENLCIERFHICTWNLKDSFAFVEFGIEIKKDQLSPEFDVFLAVPFANNIRIILERQIVCMKIWLLEIIVN